MLEGISSEERETLVSFVTWWDDLKNLRNKDSYKGPALMIMDVMIFFPNWAVMTEVWATSLG